MRYPIQRLLLALTVACVTTAATRAAEITAQEAPGSSPRQIDVGAWTRFEAEAAKSSDLRVRIAVSERYIEERDGLVYITSDAMLESLVEQARGSTDPIVLWMLASRCGEVGADQRHRCDPVAMAERWTVVDTQNQAAWLTLADALDATGRHDQARDALLRGARASMWREDRFALGRIVAAEVPGSGSPGQRLSLLRMARTIGFKEVGPFSALGIACKDTTLHDVCLRYLDVIARDADNLMALRMAAVYSARAGAPAEVTSARSRKADAYQYALTTSLRSEDDLDIDLALRRMQDRLAVSDAAWASRYLSDAHITIDESARRFAASLTPEQRRLRASAVQPRTTDASRNSSDGS